MYLQWILNPLETWIISCPRSSKLQQFIEASTKNEWLQYRLLLAKQIGSYDLFPLLLGQWSVGGEYWWCVLLSEITLSPSDLFHQSHRQRQITKQSLNRYRLNDVQLTYCCWKKSCTSQHVRKPVNNEIFNISTGAGFCPIVSTIFC